MRASAVEGAGLCTLGAGWMGWGCGRWEYLWPGVRCGALSAVLARRWGRFAWASVAEGAVWCSPGAGCAGWGCDRQWHLWVRVQGRAPWARVRRVGVAGSGGICGRGCDVVHPGHGLGGLELRPARASVAEGAVWCTLLSNRCVVGVSMR